MSNDQNPFLKGFENYRLAASRTPDRVFLSPDTTNIAKKTELLFENALKQGPKADREILSALAELFPDTKENNPPSRP